MQPQSLLSTSMVILHIVWFLGRLCKISLPGTNPFSESSSSPVAVTASCPVISSFWTQGQVTVFSLLLHHPGTASISMDCSPTNSNEILSSHLWKRSEELPFFFFFSVTTLRINFLLVYLSSWHDLKLSFHCWIVFILNTRWPSLPVQYFLITLTCFTTLPKVCGECAPWSLLCSEATLGLSLPAIKKWLEWSRRGLTRTLSRFDTFLSQSRKRSFCRNWFLTED